MGQEMIRLFHVLGLIMVWYICYGFCYVITLSTHAIQCAPFRVLALLLAVELFHHLFHAYNSYIYALLVMVTIALAQRLANGGPLFTVYADRNLEAFWTLCPSFILFGITWPSLWMIHYVERPRIGNSYEVIGNQWYWSYRQGAHNSMPEGRKRGREFDSTYVNGQLTTCASSGGENMWFVSSNDVIHNWGIAGAYKNSLGMKMDAYPGRLNVAFVEGQVYSRNHGVYLGYCSELCGLHHAYMPISLVFSRLTNFFILYSIRTILISVPC